MTGRVLEQRRVVLPVLAVAILAFAGLIHCPGLSPFTLRAIDDIGQAVAAGLGAAALAYRARRSSGRWRLSWSLIAGGCAFWAAGEVVWTYYEILLGRPTPFPSYPDLGYLLFPLLALPGVMVRPSSALVGKRRLRVLLDGAMVAASLFTLTWATALGQTSHGGGSVFALTVSLAYPVFDLIIVTVALIVLAHALSRTGLGMLLIGMILMSVSDSGFVYLVAIGRYQTGSIVDIGWYAAFLFLGAAALLSHSVDGETTRRVESALFMAVPYACVGVGGVAEGILIVRHEAATVSLIVGAGAVVAMLVRQLLTLLDNRRLLVDVMEQQDELRFQAFHDGLTGLYNRVFFTDRATHALALHARDRRPVSLLYCDLDGFKTINDSLGHDAGDALLVAVARRFESLIRPGDTFARLGGDEFAILVEDGGDVQALAAKLLDALSTPLDIGERLVPITASIGTATVSAFDPATDTQDLLKCADLAMYSAKRAGRAASVAFTPVLRDDLDDIDERLMLTEDVRSGAIRTAFQPIQLADGRPYAFEALARWRYRGLDVSPGRFIPLAERAGVLADLDLLMVRNALQRLSTSDAHGAAQVAMSVNLGASVLRRPELASRVLGLLDEFDIGVERLVFEVSETDALEDPSTRAAVASLRALGMRIAVDDFGVGYSNFSRLGDLAPDVVKLDMSLVRPLDSPRSSTRLVKAIVELAHDLESFVVAEGVETERQLATLRDLGCDAVQGFLIGRPVFGPSAGPVAPQTVALQALAAQAVPVESDGVADPPAITSSAIPTVTV